MVLRGRFGAGALDPAARFPVAFEQSSGSFVCRGDLVLRHSGSLPDAFESGDTHAGDRLKLRLQLRGGIARRSVALIL